MSEREQFDDGVQQAENTQQIDGAIYTTPDVYQTQSSQDVYQTPNTSEEHHNTGGMFSGEMSGQNSYANSQYDHNPYGNDQSGSSQFGNNAYGTNQTGNDFSGNNGYGTNQNGNHFYGNNAYGKNPSGDNSYENNTYGKNSAGDNVYENNTYNTYGKKQSTDNQYHNNQYGNQNQYGYTPYSPYAAPMVKKRTGLIVGIVITAVVLFLIALFALIYHTFDSTPERKVKKGDTEYLGDFYREYFGEDWYRENRGEEYLEEFYLEYFGDDWYEDHLDELEREKERNRDRDDDRYDDYGYDDNEDDYDDYDDDDYNYDDYDDYYNDYDDDEYYTLHDDIRDMSYSIEWEYYEYEPDDAEVLILVEYPVVVGGHVPNLERINDTIADEISVFTDYYEEEYSNYMYDDDSYFYASATGYVTYMSEDVLSVVYTEYVYTDYYDSVFLYSINIDMQDGVILDNTDIIAVDDDFSIDFRYRSDEQNGTISELDWLSDQEITELLTSPGNLIIFYTPQGMEIGFNYEDGWVTVTYHDYKDFLKIF